MTFAHAVAPQELWGAWTMEPGVLVAIALVAATYGAGLARLWRAGRGRGVAVRRAMSFYGGIAVLGIALVSPLHALGETLFSAHMVQHLILMIVAAPLLVYGAPLVALVMALPSRVRRRVNGLRRVVAVEWARRVLTGAIVVWTLHAAALWAWHLPLLYERALGNDIVHAAEHASFLGTALLFWTLVLAPTCGRRPTYPAALAIVFTTALQSSALGAILTFAADPLYPGHATGAAAWSITLLADQQLAGVIMWVPAGFVYLTTMAWLFLRWMNGMNEGREGHEGALPPALAGTGDGP
ncbi:MAG: cytochrome c oxidase assembly protein [Actinomycetota bacterium]